MTRSRQVDIVDDLNLSSNDSDDDEKVSIRPTSVRKVTQAPPCHALSVAIEDSPYIDTFYKSASVRITIDSGCTGNIVSSWPTTRFDY